MRNIFFILLLMAFTSCVTTRLNQFASFAEVGQLYAAAVEGLTQETGKVAIDADSELLLKDRDLYSPEERGDIYLDRTEALKSYLETLQQIRMHTTLLGDYFSALGELAGSDAPSTISNQLNAVVTSLGSLHPKLANASIGTTPVKDFLGEATPLVISGFKQQKLEAELRRSAPMIERELELQCALLKALASQLQTDMELLLNLKDFQSVLTPYVSAAPLGDAWKTKRREVMTTRLSMDAVDKAQTAASALKLSFTNLLENKTGMAGFTPLFNDIQAMINMVEMLRNNSENKTNK